MKSFSIEINKTAESFSFFRSKQQKGLLNKKHKDDLVWVVLTKKTTILSNVEENPNCMNSDYSTHTRILVWENRICGVFRLWNTK